MTPGDVLKAIVFGAALLFGWWQLEAMKQQIERIGGTAEASQRELIRLGTIMELRMRDSDDQEGRIRKLEQDR